MLFSLVFVSTCNLGGTWATLNWVVQEPALPYHGNTTELPCSHPVSSSSSVIQQAWWETGKDSDKLPINHFSNHCDLWSPSNNIPQYLSFSTVLAFVHTFLSCPLPNQCLTIDSRVVWLVRLPHSMWQWYNFWSNQFVNAWFALPAGWSVVCTLSTKVIATVSRHDGCQRPLLIYVYQTHPPTSGVHDFSPKPTLCIAQTRL